MLKRKRGRPAHSEHRYVAMTVNVRTDLRARIEECAVADGVTVSEWIRWAVSGAIARGATMPKREKRAIWPKRA